MNTTITDQTIELETEAAAVWKKHGAAIGSGDYSIESSDWETIVDYLDQRLNPSAE